MKKVWRFLLILVFSSHSGLAQQQEIADSLRLIYEADTLRGVEKMELLLDLAFHEKSDPDLALSYAEELILQAREAGDNSYLYHGYLQRGNMLFLQDNLDMAAKAFQTALEFAEIDGNKLNQAKALIYLGFTYYKSGEPDRAIADFNKSIEIIRNPDNLEEDEGLGVLGAAVFNLGNLYLQEDELLKARENLDEAAKIFKQVNNTTGLNYVLGNQGIIFAKLGNDEKAEENLTEAIRLLEQNQDYSALGEYQIALAEVYLTTGQYDKSHDLATQGLENVQRIGSKELIGKASRVLADLDFQSENYKEAFEHQAMYMQYKDSMDVETVDMNRLVRAQAELEAVQANNKLEVQALQRKREQTALWAVGITALLLTIIAFGSYKRYRFVKNTNQIISEERDRSDNLLQNILPKQTAMELKKLGRVRAQRFEEVTVMFTDFKGFTSHAESMDPEKLVESIDYYFSHFDTIMDKYGLEKIKTVGDAYMCASGLPYPSKDHAYRILDAALEILKFVETAKKDDSKDHVRFDIRIGINSGPVVAGVVGTKKFAYDIWGDTVNIASRMESASDVGKINISENTYEIVKDHFDCEYRGNIEVKNRGELNMYFLLGKKAKSQTA
ncbi:adenylate/guanylate cyclase domain-containing protein [Robiginitalea sp.]|uniref:adenylate/guanylate cyclase domain-containing protein n=1 Tax=Robiginitalea sp. TaxID=1902411 RepID=UPI003C74E813